MMKRLEGRSLAHPGCLIGITTGLTVGIILGGVLASVFNTPYGTILLIWFGLTIGLGGLGWLIGERLSVKFSARKSVEAGEEIPSDPSDTPST